MKKLIILALTVISTAVWAGSTTNNFRTNSGDIVSVGQTEESLIEKMGKPRPKHYVLDDGQFYCAATEYVYRVDMQEYTVILCRGKIVKIEWRNA
ncbi:hypothetical protein [Acinetobacter tandoii]|uniref:DUF2845 domain-containing protein n=1 Tax=Acinetobacter tandoii DSM 14970 = CIP 107469 TaxID=1120927 RepID=R9B1M8_9GAMM|nr:hypothetical protein [Acinetobacter tandoii]EOR08317.1 hypothetical protein I593_01673 [Acinetobacter tandoii DSM 14970 = CIP 107469]